MEKKEGGNGEVTRQKNSMVDMPGKDCSTSLNNCSLLELLEKLRQKIRNGEQK